MMEMNSDPVWIVADDDGVNKVEGPAIEVEPTLVTGI